MSLRPLFPLSKTLKQLLTVSSFFCSAHSLHAFDHFLITFTWKTENRGPWPKKKYAKLYRAQGQVLATLALLAAAYSRMSLLTCKRLATRSDLMHPAFVSPLPFHTSLLAFLAFWLSCFCCHRTALVYDANHWYYFFSLAFFNQNCHKHWVVDCRLSPTLLRTPSIAPERPTFTADVTHF